MSERWSVDLAQNVTLYNQQHLSVSDGQLNSLAGP